MKLIVKCNKKNKMAKPGCEPIHLTSQLSIHRLS